MTMANVLRDRVLIQVKTTTQTSTGETVIWKPVERKHARVIPLDVRTIALYMQKKSEVTHRVVMRGTVSLTLGNNRLLWEDKTLEPVEPTQKVGESTIIMVRQI